MDIAVQTESLFSHLRHLLDTYLVHKFIYFYFLNGNFDELQKYVQLEVRTITAAITEDSHFEFSLFTVESYLNTKGKKTVSLFC